jgi:hypothetical protein
VTLPLWWTYTVHEPRYLLPYVGLAAALVPWSMAAVSRRRRRVAAFLLATAALFSVVVGFDQAIVPLARLPVDRAGFYNRTWAVDPTAVSLPEREGMLQVTGYGLGRVDYASTYPLLGPSQQRRIVPLDADAIRGSRVVALQRMALARVRYAYVTALPEHRAEVERIFAPPAFRLVHLSTVVEAELIGARRHLFRSATSAQVAGTIARYLFHLERSAP